MHHLSLRPSPVQSTPVQPAPSFADELLDCLAVLDAVDDARADDVPTTCRATPGHAEPDECDIAEMLRERAEMEAEGPPCDSWPIGPDDVSSAWWLGWLLGNDFEPAEPDSGMSAAERDAFREGFSVGRWEAEDEARRDFHDEAPDADPAAWWPNDEIRQALGR